jgi:hypothetical protein
MALPPRISVVIFQYFYFTQIHAAASRINPEQFPWLLSSQTTVKVILNKLQIRTFHFIL